MIFGRTEAFACRRVRKEKRMGDPRLTIVNRLGPPRVQARS